MDQNSDVEKGFVWPDHSDLGLYFTVLPPVLFIEIEKDIFSSEINRSIVSAFVENST